MIPHGPARLGPMLLLAALAAAQQSPGSQNPGTAPAGGMSVEEVEALRRAQDPLDRLTSTWVREAPRPPFQGFPVFAPGLSGYGQYPGGAERPGLPPLLQLLPRGPALPPGPPENGWPGWARLRARAPVPFGEDLALLVRHSERVWWQSDAEEPFVPLPFHDKLRGAKAGAAVEVRQTGEFELIQHDGSRLVALGPSLVRIGALGAEEIVLHCERFTHLRLFGQLRAHRVLLPDGSTLRWGGLGPDDPTAAVLVHLDREVAEPGWFGGRASLTNYSDRPVVWQHAFGEVQLHRGERCEFFLVPSRTGTAAGLSVQGATRQERGETLVCTAEPAGGEVQWCGASFRLPGGASLRLEPLQGAPFAGPAAGSPPGNPAPR